MTDSASARRRFLKGALASAVTLTAARETRIASAAQAQPASAHGLKTDPIAPSELSPYFRGEVVSPDSPGYDARRRLVNAAIDKRPALIARCLGAADVVAAVHYARNNRLEIAVRGGGHHIGGYASTQGGLVIDLSLMEKAVRVDPQARTARVEGGARAVDVIAETLPFGLAAVVAGVSDVGIGGHLLGGGNGDLSAVAGFACDNLVSVDLVTADGRLITVSAAEYPDLFWAVRGSGANFGVATSFVLNLHPIPEMIQSGMLIYDLKKAKKVLQFFRDFSAGASDSCSIVCYVGPLPPAPGFPANLRGQVAVTFSFCHTGNPGQIAADLRSWREFETPDIDSMAPGTYMDFLHAQEAGYPHNRQFWDSRHSTALSDEIIASIIEQGRRLERMHLSGHQFIAFYPLKGAMAREPAIANAYTLRGGWDFPVMAFWNDAADDETQIRWAQGVTGVLSRCASVTAGAYMNFVSRSTEQRVRDFYGEATYTRLQQLKRQYDPDNLFHLNPNAIAPAT